LSICQNVLIEQSVLKVMCVVNDLKSLLDWYRKVRIALAGAFGKL